MRLDKCQEIWCNKFIRDNGVILYVEMNGGFVFKSFLSILSVMTLAATAHASDFSNNTNKPVFVQKTNPDVTCQSLECQKKLESSKNSIVLSENTVVLRGEVDGSSVSKVIADLMTSPATEINLFLSSPGGSVLDGVQLIQAIRSLNKKVTCITDFSASMSFVILQACDERVVLESSIIMQHVASFGLRHQPQPNAVSFVKFLQQVTDAIDNAQSKRLGLSTENFRKLIRDDFWLFGSEAVKAKAADRVAQVVCSTELINKEEKQTVRMMFGSATITWSKCPLITNPKSIEVSSLTGMPLDARQEEKLQREILKIVDYKADARRMIEEAMGKKVSE